MPRVGSPGSGKCLRVVPIAARGKGRSLIAVADHGVPVPGILTGVRAVLTVTLACLLVVVTAADTFACPDGCTDEAPAASLDAVSPCALCHGWSHAPVVVMSRPAPRLLARQPVATAPPPAPLLPPVEVPPKAA